MKMLAIGKMKFFILSLFALILAVSSEDETIKAKTVKEQKSDNSALYEKYLTPLNHDINRRYGLKEVVENNNEGLLRNHYNGLYDYDDEREDYLRNEGNSYKSDRPFYNVPNIREYSRNVGEQGRLVSYADRGESNVWGSLRNSEGRLRNMGGKLRQGYDDTRYRNEGYGGYGNMGLGNILQNWNVILEPEYNGYVGDVYPKGYNGVKDRYYYRLIGRKGLGFDRRTANSYGLTAPITPSLLKVVGRNRYNNNYYYYNEAGTYKI